MMVLLWPPRGWRSAPRGTCGANIGKNAGTAIEASVHDHVAAFEQLAPVADYVAINVSSPNTAQLRELQHAARLQPISRHCSAVENDVSGAAAAARLSMWSPDQRPEDLPALLRVVRAQALDGVIATNTTLAPVTRHAAAFDGEASSPQAVGAEHPCCCVRSRRCRSRVPIIAVGGIAAMEDAQFMLRAGTDLIQIYTGLVYRGPALVDRHWWAGHWWVSCARYVPVSDEPACARSTKHETVALRAPHLGSAVSCSVGG
jgi:dihydroorotate dehydrogenase